MTISPATATRIQDHEGNSEETDTSPAATAKANTIKPDAQYLGSRPGRRLEIHITAAPTPMAAKKATPKYQYGSSRPLYSFQGSAPLNRSGSNSGRMLGSGK